MPDSISNRFKMSQERLDALKEELNYLETVREKEVAELIKEARSFGDLSENSEYDEAKTEQGKLYSKIAELKVLIENAEIVDNTDENAPKDTVTLGSVVRVRDLEDGYEDKFEIVGSQEANPRAGRISDDSPMFQGMKGHRAGDTVEVQAPAGVFKFEILSVGND
ncbi:MAG: transcription elongation factor GreA [Eubacteriales bacterium]|nr:transcription elongation factor GreA [Eubacteriales bacterium]HAJ65017.1 transcription elongation factor GreA [Clostridiales bacterium]